MIPYYRVYFHHRNNARFPSFLPSLRSLAHLSFRGLVITLFASPRKDGDQKTNSPQLLQYNEGNEEPPDDENGVRPGCGGMAEEEEG